MSEPDLHTKLLNSQSFNSLTSEQRILSLMKGLGWRGIHSCFYTDSKTEKLREVDVLCRRVWECRLKNRQELADLNLVIEAKSAKGYHLLFSALEGSSAYRQANELWMGLEGEPRQLIAQMLTDAGLTVEQSANVMKVFDKMAYPNRRPRCYRLSVDPPPAQVYVSAFRETNIGGEKELESSVLWKASLSLASAVGGLKQQTIDHMRVRLKEDFEISSLIKLDPIAQVTELLDIHAGLVDLYHPIVVIDAPLWEVRDGELRSIRWCRFQQLETHGQSEWWFDVVHSDHFEKFAGELTRYYDKRYERARAKPYEYADGIFMTYPHVTKERKRRTKRKRPD